MTDGFVLISAFSACVRPDPSDPDQKLLSQRGLMDSVAGGKKRGECYVGNLPQNKAKSLHPSASHPFPYFVDVWLKESALTASTRTVTKPEPQQQRQWQH